MGDVIDFYERKGIDLTKSFSDEVTDLLGEYQSRGLTPVAMLSILGIIIKKNRHLVSEKEYVLLVNIIDNYSR